MKDITAIMNICTVQLEKLENEKELIEKQIDLYRTSSLYSRMILLRKCLIESEETETFKEVENEFKSLISQYTEAEKKYFLSFFITMVLTQTNGKYVKLDVINDLYRDFGMEGVE